MAASRYFRLVGFSTDGNTALVLSDARLCAGGVPIDAGATLTATVAPASGSVADLSDATASAGVTWPYASYSQPGFALVWDFGSTIESNTLTVRLGSGSAAQEFPYAFTLQRSNDLNAWVSMGLVTAAAYPGANTLSTVYATPDGYATSVLFDSPVRYFRMKETSGTTAVDTRGNGNGTYSGTYTLGAAGFTADGRALSVSAAGKLDCGFNTNYLTEFSVELFFNPNASGSQSNATLVGKRDYFASATTSFPFNMWWSSGSSTVQVQLAAGADFTTFATLASSALSTGVAHHVAFVYRANGLCELYVDGTRRASQTVASAIGSTTLNWTAARSIEIGGGVGQTGFAGTIAELAIYNYALLPEQISTHYDRRAASGALFPTQARGAAWPRSTPDQQRMLPAIPLDDTTAYTHLRETAFFDAYWGGLGSVVGTVKEKNLPADTPLHRRVLLLDERSQQVIREAWSDATTGAYIFRGVRQDLKYTVLAYDHTQVYRAVVADNITPEVLP